MASQIPIKSSRNKAKNKLSNRGLPATVSNTRSISSKARAAALSPAQAHPLPAKRVNKARKGASPTVRQTQESMNLRKNSNRSELKNATNSQKLTTVIDPNCGDKVVSSTNLVVDDEVTSGGVSDNTGTVGFTEPGSGSCSDLPPPPPGDDTEFLEGDPAKNILLVLTELKEIKLQVSKLDRIEQTTIALAEQIGGTMQRTGKLESAVSKNTTKLKTLDDDCSAIKSKVSKQEKALAGVKQMKEDIDKLKNLEVECSALKSKIIKQEKSLLGVKQMKEEIAKSSAETIAHMNELIDTQRAQVDSFNSGTKQLQKDILAEVERKSGTEQLTKDILAEVERKLEEKENQKEKDRYCQLLKDKAFENRFNLIITGMAEQQSKSTFKVTKNFFTEQLNLRNIEVYEARRLGQQPRADSNYARPIIVIFKFLSHRNAVWHKRGAVPPGDNEENTIRIHADLPKALRDGMQTFYKITKAATKFNDFKSVRVHDYQLEVDGKPFQITDLEHLPVQLRPLTIATPTSDTHLVFFSRHAKLSNHFPSTFTIKDQTFQTMEQFLAVRKAELSGIEDMIEKARRATDPIKAKFMLNTLKQDHQQEWDQQVEKVTLEGLRAKFGQNPSLQEYLYSTRHLTLGEASNNPRWGIGMDISDPEVLDYSKWSKTGNLLGRCLMLVREEIVSKRG